MGDYHMSELSNFLKSSIFSQRQQFYLYCIVFLLLEQVENVGSLVLHSSAANEISVVVPLCNCLFMSLR